MLSKEMVVQRYIHNPLLVNGFKFDLRVYIVIVGTNPFSAFICKEGLARFCTVIKNFYLIKSDVF
jgi:Tubulin-tyrosine ligase family